MGSNARQGETGDPRICATGIREVKPLYKSLRGTSRISSSTTASRTAPWCYIQQEKIDTSTDSLLQTGHSDVVLAAKAAQSSPNPVCVFFRCQADSLLRVRPWTLAAGSFISPVLCLWNTMWSPPFGLMATDLIAAVFFDLPALATLALHPSRCVSR